MRIGLSLLARFLIRGNLRLLLPTLALGIGLYLLTDLFEKLDNFLEAHVSFTLVATYFAVKIPLIVSQILPVIFLLSVVIQLCLMARNRELVALQAGGISLSAPARILICCGIVLSLIQLCFSEVLGVVGERESTRIWAEHVRGRFLSSAVFHDVWFKDGRWIVSLTTLEPQNKGLGFTGYEMEENGVIKRIVSAKSYTGQSGKWTLEDVSVSIPSQYTTTEEKKMILPLEQSPATFRMFTKDSTPQQLPLWQLSEIIKRLKTSGSNVEKLETAFYSKTAYAGALIVMAMLGVALVSWTSNIYIATVLALISTFIYYAVYTIGLSMGENGVLHPFIAAWGANIIGMLISGVRLALFAFGRGSLNNAR